MQNDNKNEHVKVCGKVDSKNRAPTNTGTMAHAAQVDEHNGQRGELARWQIKHGFSSIITDGSACECVCVVFFLNIAIVAATLHLVFRIRMHCSV